MINLRGLRAADVAMRRCQDGWSSHEVPPVRNHPW